MDLLLFDDLILHSFKVNILLNDCAECLIQNVLKIGSKHSNGFC